MGHLKKTINSLKVTGVNEVLGKLKNAENLKSPEKIKEEINKKKNTKR